MTDPRIVSEPRGGAEDATFVRDGLALFNVAVTGDAYYCPLAIFLKDERGAVLGGALGHVWGGWLDLDTLWVAEPFRGQGTERNSSVLPRRRSLSRTPGSRSSWEGVRSSPLSQAHPEVGEDSSSATTSPGPEKVGRPKVRNLSTSSSGAPLPSAAEARSSLLAG